MSLSNFLVRLYHEFIDSMHCKSLQNENGAFFSQENHKIHILSYVKVKKKHQNCINFNPIILNWDHQSLN